jgi:hypothetical protein
VQDVPVTNVYNVCNDLIVKVCIIPYSKLEALGGASVQLAEVAEFLYFI